jgi:hypothetical protein
MKSNVACFARAAIACGALIALAACGGAGDSNSTSGAMGTLRVALTDAPACGYDSVNVTVDRVRVHQSADAADTDSGWSEVALGGVPLFCVQ